MKILIVFFALVNLIFASVAYVSAFNGKAELTRNSKTIEVKVGLKIEKHDNIKTYEKTKMQLIFNDNTRITIGKNSHFSIEDYFYDEKKPKKVKAKFRFSKGLFRTISGRIGQINKKRFTIKVKSATIGIRGTEFDVFVTSLETKVSVYQGGIYFSKDSTLVNIKQDEYLVYDSKESKIEIKDGAFDESREFTVKKSVEQKELESEIKKVDNDEKELEVEDNDDKKSESTASNDSNQEVNNLNEGVDSIVDTEQKFSESDSSQSNPTTTIPGGSNGGTAVPNVDPTFVKEVMDTGMDDIPDLEYGYWNDPAQSNARVDTFVSGTTTTPQIIQNNINALSNTATYTGKLSSIVTKANGSKVSSSGNINLNIDFTNQTLGGNLNVVDGGWNAVINNGSVNSAGFSSTSLSSSATSDVVGIGGDINGKYYGTNGLSVGGKFNLTSPSDGSVKGTFGAKQ